MIGLERRGEREKALLFTASFEPACQGNNLDSCICSYFTLEFRNLCESAAHATSRRRILVFNHGFRSYN
jgi:hypothetical protein